MGPDTIERRATLNGRSVEEQREIEGHPLDSLRVRFDQSPADIVARLSFEEVTERIAAILRDQPDPEAIIREVGRRMSDAPPPLPRHERRRQAALARKGKRR